MSTLQKLLNPSQAAEFLQMSRRDFDLLCRRKGGPVGYALGGRIRRYSADDLERWRDPLPSLIAELLATEFRMGWVYFLRAEGGGNIKIGFGSTLRDRVADIRACSPVWLEFLGAFPGSMREEARLHRFFAEHRLHGEWFAPAPLLLRLASEITSGFRQAIQSL